MNRWRFLVIGTMVFVALTAAAQQTSSGSGSDQQQQQAVQTNVDGHLRMLTERLGLTADQQAKIRPILQQFLEGQHALMADKSLSGEQRGAKSRSLHEQAEKQVREFLTDKQQAELSQMEQESHAKASSN
jgi:Spy/CpxP family protein refolding chaperone